MKIIKKFYLKYLYKIEKKNFNIKFNKKNKEKNNNIILKTLLKKTSRKHKKNFGNSLNISKTIIKKHIKNLLEKDKNNIKQIKEKEIDISLPPIGQKKGNIHPITNTLNKANKFFKKMGFIIENGPEIENNYYNFESLNIPNHHPSKTTHDTFYINKEHMLRTHMSGIQIRTVKKKKPPIRIIAPGKVYRKDLDITHTPMFHQIEGLWIDKKSSFKNLKGILYMFLKYFFNRSLKIRFRPSYFPFTEPSAEIDIECTSCIGKGCYICKKTGWLEILGCGMVHPKILKSQNINPKIFKGCAFGIGIERLTMISYKIEDIRLFFENDLNFLSQF